MSRTIAAAALLAAFLASASALAQQQGPQALQAPAAAAPVLQDADSAHVTRMQLERLLRQYPPTVGEVLMRDPSLLNQTDYLAPYPALVAFLAQHPEVARNPGFFFGTFLFRERDPKERAFEMLGVMLGGLAGLAAFAAFISLLVWTIRAVIDHRRWLRLSRVQTEVHSKLMDRLTTNDDLLAYIQSPAGRRFLESTPIAVDGEARPMSATARMDLGRAMERLKPRDRSLLWLAYAQGWSHDEIAQALGLRTASLKSMLHRARRRLVAILGHSHDDGGRS